MSRCGVRQGIEASTYAGGRTPSIAATTVATFCRMRGQFVVLIEEDAHSRHCRRPRGVFQYLVGLLARGAREPLEKVFHGCAALDVLEQRGNGDAGSTEYSRAADTVSIAFDSEAGRPVDHALIVRREVDSSRKSATLLPRADARRRRPGVLHELRGWSKRLAVSLTIGEMHDTCAQADLPSRFNGINIVRRELVSDGLA
jgi:hypothetical protein